MKLKEILAERTRKSAQNETPIASSEDNTEKQTDSGFLYVPAYAAAKDIADERGWDF